MFNFITQRSIRKQNYDVIRCVNECRENILLEIQIPSDIARTQYLRVLYKKCKKMLSFLESYSRNYNLLNDMTDFTDKVQDAIYRGGNIDDLHEEYRELKIRVKGNSMSSTNLSSNNFL
jgi:hypothetical protein